MVRLRIRYRFFASVSDSFENIKLRTVAFGGESATVPPQIKKGYETMEAIKVIEENETYKQILKDSFGGVLYNVANRDKYDSAEVLQLWAALTPQEKDAVGGIMKGAINFVEGN